MRLFLASLLLLFGVGLLCFAAAPPPKPVRADDQLDCLFLGSDRPVLIRLHVRVGDKPYGAPWVEFMDKLFAWFDKDKDGFLSPAEVARLPNGNSLREQSRGSPGNDIALVPFAAIDTNKDGKVSREELRAYYRNNDFPAFRFSTINFQATTAKRINDAVFKRLDKSGEGHLTAAKVAGMYQKLRALDVNEDEMLDQDELDPRNAPNIYGGISDRVAYPRPVAPPEPTLLHIDPSQEAALVRQMMAQYDRNKDGKLTPAEVGIAPALFSRLDADKDGSLSAAELRAYLVSEPDLVLRLQVGTPGTGTGKGILGWLGMASPVIPVGPRLVVVNENTLGAALKKKFRVAATDSLAVELGDTRMALQVNSAYVPRGRNSNIAKDYFIEQFDMLAGKKGYVERSDEQGQIPSLFQVFSQADKDADGKLTRIELVNWLDFVATGRDVNITIIATDLGRGIFDLLDADGDGRLSLREMRGAWARLKPFAKGGKVTQADLPRSLRIVVCQGYNNKFRPINLASGDVDSPRRPASRASAPLWFRKMDKNNDGDISPREWLGTDEDFRAIDADGDGLISVEEAIAFEAKKTKAKELLP